MACRDFSHYGEAAKLWKQVLSSIFQFFALIASSKLWGHLRKKYWCAWPAEWLPDSLSILGCSGFSYVGLHPFWPHQWVGWSPACFTASSRSLQRKETFFCLSSCWIRSEDSLQSSASVVAALSEHGLQSWGRWKKVERQKAFFKSGGKYCDFLLCCFLRMFPVRIWLSK